MIDDLNTAINLVFKRTSSNAPIAESSSSARRILLGDMRIDVDKAILALSMLLEGSAIRAVEQITGLHRDTIGRLISIVGQHCKKFLGERIRHIQVQTLEADEIWAFCQMKQKVAARLARPIASMRCIGIGCDRNGCWHYQSLCEVTNSVHRARKLGNNTLLAHHHLVLLLASVTGFKLQFQHGIHYSQRPGPLGRKATVA